MPKKTVLAEGVEGLFVENKRFNTTLISFNFYLPLCKENYSANTLLAYVMSYCSDDYKNFRELNLALGNLYGATLSTCVAKTKDYQHITISVSVLNDRFSIDKDRIVSRAAELMASLIFNPSLDGESFTHEDTEREKRQLIERINGEINDKRTYARNKAIAQMFGNDPYATPRYGTVKMAEKTDGKALFEAWTRMLRNAYVLITVVGETLPAGIFEAASAAFSAIHRENVTKFKGYSLPQLDNFSRVTERMDIAQGKLVLGFATNKTGSMLDLLPAGVMSDIFGGGPYSRLFMNVREKQSLCYYCACNLVRSKGFMLVDCGIEPQNAEMAEKEILKQLDVMKNGGFTDEEFDSSIRSICDSVNSISDSQESISLWYAINVFDDSAATPDKLAEHYKKVTRQQVIEAAQAVEFKTVYTLLPEEK